MQMMDGSQNVVASYKYDAWGNDLTDPQSPIFNPFRYVGGLGYYSDKDSGLKLLGVRYYDSQIGRFWSLDLIKEGWNWYVYVNNNPVNLSDPTGYSPYYPYCIAQLNICLSYCQVRFNACQNIAYIRFQACERSCMASLMACIGGTGAVCGIICGAICSSGNIPLCIACIVSCGVVVLVCLWIYRRCINVCYNQFMRDISSCFAQFTICLNDCRQRYEYCLLTGRFWY